MQQQDFIEFIKNPESLSREDIEEIRGIIKEYPYFQTARFLYLKYLHDNKDIKFEKELKLSSAYIIDRYKLFSFLKQKRRVSKEIVKKREEKKIKEEKEKISVSPVHSEQKIFTVHFTSFDIYKEISASLESDIVYQKQEKVKFYNYKVETQAHKITDNISLIREEAQKYYQIFYKTADHKIIKSGEQELSPGRFYDSKRELIDKFLTVKPQSIIVEEDDDDTAVEDLAVQSIREDYGFITETLAEIYVKQGHYDKAIKAYEKLCLKNKDKSIYFAKKIEEIKKLKNN